MTARDLESAMLTRCAQAAHGIGDAAQSQQEANVFRLASMVMRPRLPEEAARLWQAAQTYFAHHPDALLPSADVVRRGWVQCMPRLRDLLTRQILSTKPAD